MDILLLAIYIIERLKLSSLLILKKFLLALSVLLTINVILGVSSQYLQGVEYFYGKSVARVISDFAFFEAAVIFFAGAFSAFYSLGFRSRELKLVAFAAVMLCVSVAAGMV
jgi:hypothetical protein